MAGFISISARYPAPSPDLAAVEAHRALNELSMTVLPFPSMAKVSPAPVPAYYIDGSIVFVLADSVALGYAADGKTVVATFTSANFVVKYNPEAPPTGLPLMAY